MVVYESLFLRVRCGMSSSTGSRGQTKCLSLCISALFTLLFICIFRTLLCDIPGVVQQFTSTTAFSLTEVGLAPVSQVFVAP